MTIPVTTQATMIATLLGPSRCGVCSAPATMLAMQACGAPGGPTCQGCWDRHAAFMVTMAYLALPYCRHCDDDVDPSHVFTVPLP